MYKYNTKAHSHNHYCHAKARTIKYSEYVLSVALVIHHAQHMGHIILSLSHKWHNCQKKVIDQESVFQFSLHLLSKHFSFKKESSKILSQMYTHLHAKYPILLSDFNETSIFLIDVRAILKYPISWKATQWEPGCSTQTNGQTNIDRHDEANTCFSQFCKDA
jgi:hypothetical protein